MRLFLFFCVSVTLIKTANLLCTNSSWVHSFDSAGQSVCRESKYYINGFDRNTYMDDDKLYLLEGVQCCSAPHQWSDSEIQVNYADWTNIFDRFDEWAYCPAGFFLHGLYRSLSISEGYLGHIEDARCTKPANHPFYYGECYVQNINFITKGLYSCKEGYYITGLHKGNCKNLHCLDSLQCCKMADKPMVIDDIHKLKTNIMDTTLWNLANLAHLLGYGWCLGTKGSNVGEDFYRSGDSWVADSRLFWPLTKCEGDKCNERLAIDYIDWNLAVKETKYGQSVVDELKPDAVHTGVEFNHLNESSSKLFEYSKTVTETIEHSTTSSWKNSHEVSVSLNFNLFNILQTSLSYKTTFENSRSTTDNNSQMKSDTLKISTTQTIPPRSAAKFTVLVGKTRTTIPYTAVIIARFNVKFRGFLRWGKGFGSATTNYHHQHKGSGDRPTVPYTFGDKSEAFYTALKRESETQAMPWLWNEMIKNYPSARQLINRLTNETQYEFTLNGKLEHVAGTKIDVIWENARLSRRSIRDKIKSSTPQFDNSTFFATVGPNDKPVDVKYPEVVLVNSEPFQLESIPVDPNSI
ncbi:uncharacterized protein LOC129927597 [Biomphalaria glabrata]|uniref:Uncharacterized protein LOC129927597 n=1 Tax=Biomphalaria glabrata TaxID=6526 RepID=A0A9W3B124_BIOGL|nr:uncharacterized protein LOC129927597 [Biomphalaria glabrata]